MMLNEEAMSISMPRIPRDLIIEILTKLPVKSLLKFKSVCKSWYSIITDPQFVKLHSKSPRLFLHCLAIRFDGAAVEEYHSVDYEAVVDKCVYYQAMVKFQFPLKEAWVSICGSCNGLIFMMSVMNELFVWNPSTGDLKELPQSDLCFLINQGSYCHGFGYDKSIDDYKVVVYGFSMGLSPPKSHVQVLTLKTNTWGIIQDVEFYRNVDPYYGVFANGALHWIANPSSSSETMDLIAFDLAEEKFQVLPQPEPALPFRKRALSVVNGWLCLCKGELDSGIDVWIMKEYGVKESWIKLITVPPHLFQNPNVWSCDKGFLPLCISRDGDIFGILDDHLLIECNVKKNWFRCIKTDTGSIFNHRGKKFRWTSYRLIRAIWYEESLESTR
ncbi:hypothetical protein GH714_035571 [Hevea brasiliensis]|uniref:F-box domain-containing protein n=1 Tax=Hevea brasiliensis TaxID=3981 RepID=A0A6A6L3P0_HEVBR|nr:hypothetical protein GH714_035571 [Hevea brasiliensis]